MPALAGAYQNTGTKRLWLSRNRLVGVTEVTTSATFLYWQPTQVSIAPGGSLTLTAAEAGTCAPTLTYMTALLIAASERVSLTETTRRWVNPIRLTAGNTVRLLPSVTVG